MTIPVGYYDLETAGWDSYVVGGYLAPGATAPVLIWHDAATLLSELVRFPGTEWRAHNGGRYDSLLMMTIAAREGWKIRCSMRGASVLTARLTPPGGGKRSGITLADTFALAPVGLEKFARAAGGVQKGAFDYESITPGLDPRSSLGKLLAEYLRDDLLSLRDADTAWRQVIREVAGVEPGRTIGGTAWKSASRFTTELPGEDTSVALPTKAYQHGRAGYFGGRVEVYRTRAPLIHRYDRNSSYPAALTLQPVPFGERVWKQTWNGEPGTVWATVEVAEGQRVAPLPVRHSDGGRVWFPTGIVSGAWAANELEAAINDGAARLLRVNRARLASSTSLCLREWCLRVWNARVERPAWNGLLKLLANSLTGKLAQRPDTSTVGFGDRDEDPAGARALTKPDAAGMHWWALDGERVSPCARPEWAAYLTAEARVEHTRQLRAAGDSLVYGDTDSVYSERRLDRRLGDGLGEWKYEGAGELWKARAPKLYRYGEKVKAKGFPGLTVDGFERVTAPPEEWPRDEAGEPARPTWALDRGVDSLLTTVRRDGGAGFKRRDSARGLALEDSWCGGRVRLAGSHDTRPPTVQETLDRE